MKVLNWFTISLIITALASLIYSILDFNLIHTDVFLITCVIVMILEVLPLRLPSGDGYSAGGIGWLFLLLYEGFSAAVLAIFLAVLAYYLKNMRKRRIPLMRLLVTLGMYIASIVPAYILLEALHPTSIFATVIIAAISLEVTNFIYLEGIEATVLGKKMFKNLKQKVSELVIPIFVSIIVLSKLLYHRSEAELISLMLYTLFFLLVVILFSNEFMKQLALRKESSKAFIQVLEGRIKSSLTGHGNRVAEICEILLDDFSYPKRKRHDLVQAAIIHDIGKALLPSYIFRKRGDLTLSEEREYKKHPEKAMEIVKTMFPNESFSDWILHHHERWDGKGFPKRLQGEEIPLGARILAIGNELDHIISRHQDKETILKLLREKAGTVLDPKLVDKIDLFHIEQMLYTVSNPNIQNELTEDSDMISTQYSEVDTYSHIGESFFVTVKSGVIYNAKGKPSNEFILELAETSMERQKPVNETYMDANEHFNVHAIPFSGDEAAIFVHNITPYMQYRKRLEHNILESYVMVINTISQGKVKLLTTKAALECQLGEQIGEMAIRKSADVPKTRAFAKEILEQFPVDISTMKVLVAISEAASNIIKHATAGTFSVYKKEGTLQFLLSDKGSGIPLHELPKAILISGYSSKRSLGRGYNLIANYSNGLQIYSCSEGTSLLIEYPLLAMEASISQ
ncbi:HD domain-containing phosphohydrolase [Cytobacillus firmus]|uniref:Protein RpfG n=1 Tax=Cytobacillus firmus DS1 TaxID=1307436 RepID=W7L8G7_CYTFI|nr:HD domain-containing phosphohydrolase [Cytobacillus firmus]EWG11557.1 protein RpfG [Cytobacillus firmus DS1]